MIDYQIITICWQLVLPSAKASNTLNECTLCFKESYITLTEVILLQYEVYKPIIFHT